MKKFNLLYMIIFLFIFPALVMPQIIGVVHVNYKSKTINDELTNVINKLQSAINEKNRQLISALIYKNGKTETVNNKRSIDYKSSGSLEIKNIDPDNFNIRFEIINKRKLNDKRFMLITAITMYGEVNKINIKINIEAVKKGEQWFIINNSIIKKIISTLIKPSKRKPSKSKKTYSITSSLDRINNTALIPQPHVINPTYYDINRSVTRNFIDRDLFAVKAPIDVLAIVYNTTINDVAVFATDLYWNRIIYTEQGTQIIKAISKTDVNLPEWHITGIAAPTSVIGTDHFLYVVSAGHNCKITKLKYDHASNNLQFIANYSVPGARTLWDISIEAWNNEVQGPRLWVVDPNTGIYILNTSGNVLATYTKFYYNGQYYLIKGIEKLEVSNSAPTIGFIDKGGRRLVICNVNESENNRLEAYNVVEFPTSSLLLGDIGINFDSELYFSQWNIIHKFDMYGEYICSFKNSSWFNAVGTISNIAFNNADFVIPELFINNRWSDNYGIRRYLPGSDAMDLSFQQLGYNSLQFNYRITGVSYVKVEILQNNNAIATLEEVPRKFSGFHTIVKNYNYLSPGNYQLKVSYKHWQDQNYGNYQQGLRAKLINFTVTAEPHYPPVITSITQSPIPIHKGSSGYFDAHLSQGSLPLTYNWSARYLPAGAYISQYGVRCRLTYPSTQSVSLNGIKGLAEITCTVSNGYGTSTMSFTPSLSSVIVGGGGGGGGGGCPTIAFEKNGIIENENPILAKSVVRQHDVTDYYLFQKDIKSIDKKIKFIIYEPENEHTYLDQVELLEVKLRPDELVAVSEGGEIFNYKLSPKALKLYSNNSDNISDMLSFKDNRTKQFDAGDSLSVNLEQFFSKQENDELYLILSGEAPIKKIYGAIRVTPTNSDGSLDDTASKEIFFRPKKSIVALKLNNNTGHKIAIQFLQDIEIDYVSVVKKEKPVVVTRLELIDAVHNKESNVKALLNIADKNYTELLHNEKISFTFASKNNTNEKTAYILKTVGRYEENGNGLEEESKQTEGEGIVNVPTETKLIGNYPNPFNPTTQISYQLQKAAFVKIKIYDILGKEVKTLVNKSVDAGLHQVLFDAYGLSSGIYMLTMQTKGKYEVRKMLLMR